MTSDISEQELSDTAAYLREYGRRLSRLLPAAKMAQAHGEDVDNVEVSLNELVPLDIESALRPFHDSPRSYLPFQWALSDLLQKFRAVADFNIDRQAPPGLFSLVRHAIRVVGFALLRLQRVTEDETVSPELKRRKRARTLRQRVPAFEDFARTPPEVVEVIRAYRARLDDSLNPLGYDGAAHHLSPGPFSCHLTPDWVLPHSKETIEKALRTALGIARNRRIRRNLSVDLERLKNYVPAEAIPVSVLEQIEVWEHVHAPYFRRHERQAKTAKRAASAGY
jgi:hypothetical protein